ncbi:hypothetical protein DFH08DRAFT_848027 [Mycena albidolilacea]|uniref:Protein kinase domain-containing protein n=1 Tax=Mycena albidolilacea TaxID=1033008 RepID=A0AAD7EXW0_9AGAR|nr:hypothetical protein DFH08DRAFT_848027 [Mycena albidolilacea]
MIPLGDLDLRSEIHQATVSRRRTGRGYTRRIYSAYVDGKNSKKTVALYQGRAAEEVWRRDLKRYPTLRHPNVAQVYATATSYDLYAVVFHDELLPIEHTLRMYRHSPILTAYLLGNFAMDAYDAEDYIYDVTGHCSFMIFNSAMRVRASTGRLCIELIPCDDVHSLLTYTLSADRIPQGSILSLGVDQELAIISTLTLDQFHQISFQHMGHSEVLSTNADIDFAVGSVTIFPRKDCGTFQYRCFDEIVEVAHITSHILHDPGWGLNNNSAPSGLLMENGWTRFTSCEITETCVGRVLRCHGGPQMSYGNPWLPQANHIFNRLQNLSHYEDYVFTDYIGYFIYLRDTPHVELSGYLFICPLQDLQSATSGRFSIRDRDSDCVAYWTLDAAGGDRLSPKEAKRLGFPALSFSAHAHQISWDRSVYAGLRQFHTGKGFDPDSQDIAQYVGVPLYQLSAGSDALFAQVEEGDPKVVNSTMLSSKTELSEMEETGFNSTHSECSQPNTFSMPRTEWSWALGPVAGLLASIAMWLWFSDATSVVTGLLELFYLC